MLMPSLALGAPIRSPNALGAPIRSPNAHYEPPKFIMNTSFIMNLIMRFLVFQCSAAREDQGAHGALATGGASRSRGGCHDAELSPACTCPVS